VNPLRSIFRTVTGARVRELEKKLKRTQRVAMGAIQAARTGAGGYRGIDSNRDEDAANKESQRSLAEVLQRSQDLDINNPDLRGFHRARTAQIVGAHVRFKASPKPEEVGVDPAKLLEIAGRIDHLRHLHSRTGGFDSTGKNRSEGTQQSRSVLTALIHGSCLIHRVWRPENPILPLSLELIPGVRISTPIDRQGDPLLSYGIEYADEHRSKVVAYHVRRPSKSVGDSFVPDYTWDRLPAADCSLLELPEAAGMDRSMPLAVACVRMLRNRGEFLEAAVESARAQAGIYAHTEVAAGADPWQAAADDAAEGGESAADPDGVLAGFVDMGPVKMLYGAAGEKVNWNAARLPDPDFVGFNDVADERLSRGLSSSKSRFTRRVNSSWAGGRLEDQQDDPIVDQYREAFCAAWQKVNVWLLEAIWLTGAIDLPNYSGATRVLWEEFRVQFPGKLHINPVDTMQARQLGFSLRTITPQQACEEDGRDFREQMKGWAEATKITREAEKAAGLEEGSLDIRVFGGVLAPLDGSDNAQGGNADDGDKAGAPPADRYRTSRHRRVASAGAR